MKATRPGMVVGIALEPYVPSAGEEAAIGSVMVFAESSFWIPPMNLADSNVSAKQNIDLSLVTGGAVNVKNAQGSSTVTIDELGNAYFAGEVTVDTLNAANIIGLPDVGALQASVSQQMQMQVAVGMQALQATLTSADISLAQQLASQSTRIDALSARVDAVVAAVASMSVPHEVNLAELAAQPTALTFNGEVTIAGGLRVDSISSIGDALNLMGDVYFFGRPYVNNDTAGFAVIEQGARFVDVVFTREYLSQPVVNANISVEASDSLTEETLFANNIQYVVTKKTVNGFRIVLNADAPGDIRFSWMALAVQNANTFFSVRPVSAPFELPTPIATPMPQATPIDFVGIDPSVVNIATPTPEPTPAVTPDVTTVDPNTLVPSGAVTPEPTLTPDVAPLL
jgi:hypothetical protein